MRFFVGLAPIALLLAACAGHDAPPASAPVLSLAPSLDTETRTILEELVRVDTSHGGETKALTPILARLREAGIQGDIYESSPGRGNLVARIKGNGTKRPLLLLAHVDVVPVEGQPWTTPPFVPTEKEGLLYGRGVNDDKSMVASITVVALELAKQKTALSRDIILAFTVGEETGGEGVRWLLANHKELIDAEFALNEGGYEVLTPDATQVHAVGFSAAEKAFQSFRLTVKGKGGHSSTPPTDFDPAAALGRALGKLGDYKFPMRITAQSKDQIALFAASAKPEFADAVRRAVAGGPDVQPADAEIIGKDAILNAFTRTTCVTTMLRGSPQENVLPTEVEAIVNCRIMPDETRESVEATLVRVIGDPAVTVTLKSDWTRGPAEDASGPVPDAVRKVAARIWPKAIVVPVLTTGATDSRFLRGAGIHSYGVATSMVTREDLRGSHRAHGPDERRPVKWIGEGTRYLREIVLELGR